MIILNNKNKETTNCGGLINKTALHLTYEAKQSMYAKV